MKLPSATKTPQIPCRSTILSGSIARMEGDLQKALGRNIRKLRLERGFNQQQMADLLKVHRTYVGSWERGERNITMKTLTRLAEHLGVEDPFDLLREENSTDPSEANSKAVD